MIFKNSVESKNIKRFYVPKTLVVYFSDQDLTIFENFSRNITEHTEFIQIGSYNETNDQVNKTKICRKTFYPWLEMKNNEPRIMKASTFISGVGSSFIETLKSTDICIFVYNSNNVDVLDYIEELSSIACKNDVFTFHFTVKNFVQSSESRKKHEKLVKSYKRKRQLYVPIDEKSIVLAYKNSTITSRKYYTNLYINSLIDLFLSPFLDPTRNPDAFSKMKALFYKERKNFESKVITSMGYSDAKVDNIDLALIQALSNPMFAAAFDASNTFIVDVKMPFFIPEYLERINQVLKTVVGEWKHYYVNSFVGPFDYDKYCQVSIMAINVDDSKLIEDKEEINLYIKKILNNVQKSKQLFKNDETKELVLEKRIELIEK